MEFVYSDHYGKNKNKNLHQGTSSISSILDYLIFTFVAPQEDEDQVVQDAADAAGALMYVLVLILTIVIGIYKSCYVVLSKGKASRLSDFKKNIQ